MKIGSLEWFKANWHHEEVTCRVRYLWQLHISLGQPAWCPHNSQMIFSSGSICILTFSIETVRLPRSCKIFVYQLVSYVAISLLALPNSGVFRIAPLASHMMHIPTARASRFDRASLRPRSSHSHSDTDTPQYLHHDLWRRDVLRSGEKATSRAGNMTSIAAPQTRQVGDSSLDRVTSNGLRIYFVPHWDESGGVGTNEPRDLVRNLWGNPMRIEVGIV